MKPIKLTMQAFGPFAKTEVIDFEKLGIITIRISSYVLDSFGVPLVHTFEVEVEALELGEALLTEQAAALDLHLADVLGG